MANNELKVTSSDTHFENVLACYTDDRLSEVEKMAMLSDIEKKLKKRWETAFMSLLEFRSPEQAVKNLIEVFGVSKPTAYRDVQRCEMLFGSFKRFNKEAWRYISIERKHELYQLALREKNFELAYKIDISIDKLLGLDQEDSPIDLDKIRSQNYDIIISNKQARLVKQILSQGGAVDMNVSNTVDIDFEEIKGKANEGK